MSERVLTRRELNRALLARQLLLERRRLPLPRVLELGYAYLSSLSLPEALSPVSPYQHLFS